MACDSSKAELGTETPGRHSCVHRPRLAQRHLRVNRRVDGSVHGDQVVPPDELVELDVVHVAALPSLGGVQHDQHVVSVAVHLRHAIALDAVPDRKGMEGEHLRQHARAVVVAVRDVNPDQPGFTPEQRRQFLRRAVFNALLGHQANIHRLTPPARSQASARARLLPLRPIPGKAIADRGPSLQDRLARRESGDASPRHRRVRSAR